MDPEAYFLESRFTQNARVYKRVSNTFNVNPGATRNAQVDIPVPILAGQAIRILESSGCQCRDGNHTARLCVQGYFLAFIGANSTFQVRKWPGAGYNVLLDSNGIAAAVNRPTIIVWNEQQELGGLVSATNTFSALADFQNLDGITVHNADIILDLTYEIWDRKPGNQMS